MKIPFKTLELRPRRHVVGCGVQGAACLALDLSSGKDGGWSINWAMAGELGDQEFAARLSKKTGNRHFWVSPCEEGGLQVETARAIEIPEGSLVKKGRQEDFFLTQVKSRFVNEKVVFGGMRMAGAEMRQGGVTEKIVHNVGGGAIVDNVMRDYHSWYSVMSIRRPHIASTAMALANAYLALYPLEKRLVKPLRFVLLKGRSVYRGILMDGWKYIDEVLLPRMVDDDSSRDVIEGRMQGWIEYFTEQHPNLVENRRIEPLVITVAETHRSEYEHWDLWEGMAMTGEVSDVILKNRDIAPLAFGMALQGGC